MDSIFEWGMNQYAEEIHNISQSATKEMTIEKVSPLSVFLSWVDGRTISAAAIIYLAIIKGGDILSS